MFLSIGCKSIKEINKTTLFKYNSKRFCNTNILIKFKFYKKLTF